MERLVDTVSTGAGVAPDPIAGKAAISIGAAAGAGLGIAAGAGVVMGAWLVAEMFKLGTVGGGTTSDTGFSIGTPGGRMGRLVDTVSTGARAAPDPIAGTAAIRIGAGAGLGIAAGAGVVTGAWLVVEIFKLGTVGGETTSDTGFSRGTPLGRPSLASTAGAGPVLVVDGLGFAKGGTSAMAGFATTSGGEESTVPAMRAVAKSLEAADARSTTRRRD
jgi:hypothetical protein